MRVLLCMFWATSYSASSSSSSSLLVAAVVGADCCCRAGKRADVIPLGRIRHPLRGRGEGAER